MADSGTCASCQTETATSSCLGPEGTVNGPLRSSPLKREGTRNVPWPKKAALSTVRADGMSTDSLSDAASGCLSFSQPSTQQQLLVWQTQPKTVLVLKKLDDELHAHFVSVIVILMRLGLCVIVEPHEYAKTAGEEGMQALTTYQPEEASRLHAYVDFIVCLGGDGTLLHASSLFQGCIPPIISFAQGGSLGFLTNHRLEEAESDLTELIRASGLDGGMVEERVHVTLRMRLRCTIVRAAGSPRGQADTYEVLNEVVVDRGVNPFLTKVECWEHDRLITKVQADGVLLATPTGSTAYSVAAGGSMVHPNVPSILFTPICPHSLSFRPVILPDYTEIELRIPADARCTAWVCFDGKNRQELHQGDAVRVRMSTNPVPTITKTDQTGDWFGSLQRCFGWNDRLEQKPLHHASSFA